MRSHRHLDQVGPLSFTPPLPRSRSRLARVAIIVLSVWLGTAVAWPAQQSPPGPPSPPPDPLVTRSKGAATAPVTVYEMADFQCPACRTFTLNVMPVLQKQFVESGKVRWIFVNFPLVSIHPNAMAAAEVAMCASHQKRFWETHDALYYGQDEWAKLEQPRATLITLAQRAGVNRTKLVACLDSATVRPEIEQDAQRSMRAGANSTPSFYIEGGLLQGSPSTPEPMVRILDSIYTARTRAHQ